MCGTIKQNRVLTRPLDLPRGNVSLRELTFDSFLSFFFLKCSKSDINKARTQSQRGRRAGGDCVHANGKKHAQKYMISGSQMLSSGWKSTFKKAKANCVKLVCNSLKVAFF